MESILDKEFEDLKATLQELGYEETGSSGNWWEQEFFSTQDKSNQLSSLLKRSDKQFSTGKNKDGHLVFSDMKNWSIISIGADSIIGKQHKGHYMKIVMDAVPMNTQKNESKNVMKIKVSQLKKVIREVVEEAGQHKCEECGKVLSVQDKSSYETEGGEGWPSVCEDCAEDAALSEASSEIEVDYTPQKKKASVPKKTKSKISKVSTASGNKRAYIWTETDRMQPTVVFASDDIEAYRKVIAYKISIGEAAEDAIASFDSNDDSVDEVDLLEIEPYEGHF